MPRLARGALVAAFMTLFSAPVGVATAGGQEPCPVTAASAFSWWIGEWSYSVPGFDPGTTTVTKTDGGCALREEFVDIRGQKAHTTIRYDATAQRWVRVVIDPFRKYESVGRFAPDGSVAFYESPASREVYRPTGAGSVAFSGDSSSDGGRSWRTLFEATYTRVP